MSNLDANFEKIFSKLFASREAKVANYLYGISSYPVPMFFGDVEKEILPPNSFDTIPKFFEPTDAWKAYSRYVAGDDQATSTINIKMAAKIQNDYLGQAKREYLMQNTSRIQGLANEMLLRERNSKAGGPLVNSIIQRVRTLLEVENANQ